MKVTLIQQDVVWAQPKENMIRAARAIASDPGSDLYVLPEMWNTGFATKPTAIADSENGEALQWMKQKAAETGAAIVGSVATRLGDGTYRNRCYFVKPSGETEYYDKHHLFTYGGENVHYTAGQKRKVVEWKGVRFLLLVCYDLRFPIWSRNHDDYDAIIYVGSWPTKRHLAWRTLVRARAIENQCYVLAANRVGNDPQSNYTGGTTFVDPYGRDMECPDHTETVLTGTIDMDFLMRYQKKFPLLRERDESLIIRI